MMENKWWATLRDSLAYKTKHSLTIQFSSWASTELKMYVHEKPAQKLIEVLSIIAKSRGNQDVLLWWMDKQTVVQTYKAILFGDKKEWNISPHNID